MFLFFAFCFFNCVIGLNNVIFHKFYTVNLAVTTNVPLPLCRSCLLKQYSIKNNVYLNKINSKITKYTSAFDNLRFKEITWINWKPQLELLPKEQL